jgi:two-component system cell cycle response regulator DivK
MSGKILVVEDNELNRKLIVAVLTYHGYKTLEAMDGAEGIIAAVEHMPDLILMDIQMPVMDGMTAINILKNDPRTQGVKVIALTSFAMKDDRERFIGAGFVDYIAKPINTRELPELLKKYLSAGKP